MLTKTKLLIALIWSFCIMLESVLSMCVHRCLNTLLSVCVMIQVHFTFLSPCALAKKIGLLEFHCFCYDSCDEEMKEKQHLKCPLTLVTLSDLMFGPSAWQENCDSFAIHSLCGFASQLTFCAKPVVSWWFLMVWWTPWLKNKLGKKGFILSCISQGTSITEGSWAVNLEAGTQAEAIEKCLLAYSSWVATWTCCNSGLPAQLHHFLQWVDSPFPN